MDRKAPVDGWSREDSPAYALAQDVGGIARDLATIAELQMRLFTADLKAVRKALLQGTIAFLAALIVLLTTLPIALAGLGLWLAEANGWTPAAGLLVVALVAVIVVAALVAFGAWQLRSQRRAFENSRRELSENLIAVRQLMKDYAGRTAADE
jgi:hypothetical protein